MAWPTDTILTINMDQGADSAAVARADIYNLALVLKAIIAGRGTASGVASLDATTKVPVAQIPALSYLPLTGGMIVGATTIGAPLGVTGQVTFTNTLQVTSNIVSTAGNISTSGGIVNGTKNSQVGFNSAGVQSTSTTGNSGIGLHCSGTSAAYIEHVRGGSGIRIIDNLGIPAAIAGSTINAGLAYTAYCYLSADAANSIYAFDNGDYFGYSRANNTLDTVIGNSALIRQSVSGIYPITDGTLGCGVPTNRWAAVYATNGTIQTSDKRAKVHVGPVEDVGATIDAIEPVRFLWKQYGAQDIGFYAQDLAELVPEAVERPIDEHAMWGLKPDRLIPLLVAEIQSMRKRILALEAK